MKRILAIFVALTLVFAMAACSGQSSTSSKSDAASEGAPSAGTSDSSVSPKGDDGKITIGYSLKTVQEERWQRELNGCKEAASKLGVNFVYQVANGDAQTQISQIENLMTQGIDVLMVTAVDAGALSNVLETAKNQGIKVLIYDQQLTNSYGDAFVGYDDFSNGSLIAQVLDTLKVSGNVVLLNGDKTSGIESVIEGEKSVLSKLDVKIVMEQYCQNWAAENSLGYAQNALSQYKNNIAAFVCMNDGIASGAIQALTDAGIAGKVVVTGMDCELTAVQRIAKGTQTSTLYKDSAALSQAAIETAVKLAKGEKISDSKTINFGVDDMPHVVVNSVVITKDNIDSALVDKGVYTKEEVYGK
ncbi:substrate-binding domain-containing protein [Clostridium sp. KNHs216]|uniref:sugar ABC transporter substrate-binding protein n=1 Tax=Clostridium sp. KNHs216 TaxID=1550235 RepID=UPI00115146E0|nr:substrate-binding domain-containing protein [Clostridium sp. KNHs216]TQI67055.1 D-xylose transport system substrate-binding protein [Clostridium sp. KNHs216]